MCSARFVSSVGYEQSPICPQGQWNERNASQREKHPTREKVTRGGEREFVIFLSPHLVYECVTNEPQRTSAGRLHLVSRFSRGMIFTRARVSLALLPLRTNGGLLVVYFFSETTKAVSQGDVWAKRPILLANSQSDGLRGSKRSRGLDKVQILIL